MASRMVNMGDTKLDDWHPWHLALDRLLVPRRFGDDRSQLTRHTPPELLRDDEIFGIIQPLHARRVIRVALGQLDVRVSHLIIARVLRGRAHASRSVLREAAPRDATPTIPQ
eukprot:scaffold148380_cov28-Tisochrysis_lutea.AAC.2